MQKKPKPQNLNLKKRFLNLYKKKESMLKYFKSYFRISELFTWLTIWDKGAKMPRRQCVTGRGILNTDSEVWQTRFEFWLCNFPTGWFGSFESTFWALVLLYGQGIIVLYHVYKAVPIEKYLLHSKY